MLYLIHEMTNIILIGCGNIGLRHFQSLLTYVEPLNIYIVEPDLSKKIKIDNLYKDNAQNKRHTINLYTHHLNLPLDIKMHVLIIATSSSVRSLIIEDIFKNNIPQFTLLEKFLFQDKKDYFKIEEIFLKSQAKVWVNQNMVIQEAFREVADYFKASNKIEMAVCGGNWGLCCNHVHFIDYFDYLTMRKGKMKSSLVKFRHTLPSKRNGFYDIIGRVEIVNQNLSTLILETDDDKKNDEVFITIKDDQNSISLRVNDNIMNGEFLINNKKFSKEYKNLYQSELTSKIVYNLLNNFINYLPTYSMSKNHHLVLFDEFNDFFKGNNLAGDNFLPIT